MIGAMTVTLLRLSVLLALLPCAPAARAEPATPAPQPRENVSVRADLAWEDRDGDAVHVQGHVEMRAARWALAADRARLRGALDAPEQVVAEGSPARMRFEQAGDEGPQRVDASGQTLEYERKDSRVALSGRAELRRDQDLMQGERIEYWRDTDRFSAGGEGRLRLVISPGAKRSAPGTR